ncbi:MAG: hypothetical protein AB2672_03010 [Candidatus Thiodiazotropha endolucinida]|nr:hypothetical protein [Candidatus Thiodiazotropha taylori]MCW4264486.1 hypothetical protein [Candidatus Thiodiazotropha endolucinida]MCG7885569.1 hypothetical protein [Candidatus Thiodiazotropha taylori]MCG7891567.1 hypothetical protein [Candidatus Thiodiazotropha taylori]MCG7953649.1 hypothetical protein [Candidatus Thiodiazotropha taylori]
MALQLFLDIVGDQFTSNKAPRILNEALKVWKSAVKPLIQALGTGVPELNMGWIWFLPYPTHLQIKNRFFQQ